MLRLLPTGPASSLVTLHLMLGVPASLVLETQFPHFKNGNDRRPCRNYARNNEILSTRYCGIPGEEVSDSDILVKEAIQKET